MVSCTRFIAQSSFTFVWLDNPFLILCVTVSTTRCYLLADHSFISIVLTNLWVVDFATDRRTGSDRCTAVPRQGLMVRNRYDFLKDLKVESEMSECFSTPKFLRLIVYERQIWLRFSTFLRHFHEDLNSRIITTLTSEQLSTKTPTKSEQFGHCNL